MPRAVGPRLSAMMFLHYFVMGAWVVTLTTYLHDPAGVGLQFSQTQIGLIYSTLAIGGFVAPLFVGLLADRFFNGERVMGVLALLSAALLGAAGWWCDTRDDLIEALVKSGGDVESATDRTFYILFLIMLGYSVCLLMNSTLANVLTMRNLADPARHFGGIRLWGTVGWLVAGLVVWPLTGPMPIYLAAVITFVMGLYAFTLPRTPPKGRSSPILEVIGLPALTLFRNFSFVVFLACLFVVTVMQQWYGVFAPQYLTDVGVRPATAWMTVAQVVEICCLLLIPALRERLGLKGVMMLGLLAWIIRNAAFTWGDWWVIVVIGLPLHGASYTFFTILGALYIDRLAPPHLRAGAQGLITLVSLGPGMMLGNQASAWSVEHATVNGVVDWAAVWLVPFWGCVAALGVFALLFRAPSVHGPGEHTAVVEPPFEYAPDPKSPV